MSYIHLWFFKTMNSIQIKIISSTDSNMFKLIFGVPWIRNLGYITLWSAVYATGVTFSDPVPVFVLPGGCTISFSYKAFRMGCPKGVSDNSLFPIHPFRIPLWPWVTEIRISENLQNVWCISSIVISYSISHMVADDLLQTFSYWNHNLQMIFHTDDFFLHTTLY